MATLLEIVRSGADLCSPHVGIGDAVSKTIVGSRACG
jgi:hypothetical protein